MSPLHEPKSLLDWLVPQLPNMLRTLETFVRTESPSTEKAAADACAQVIAAEWSKRRVRGESLEQKHRGGHLPISAVTGNTKPGSQVLVLGDYGTVCASGTLAKMPVRPAGGLVYDAGVFD